MDSAGALISVLVGLLCAVAGILARPKSATAADRNRALLTAAAAAVPVLAWILWVGHPFAVALAFVVGTLVAGQVRDGVTRRGGSGAGSPVAPQAEAAEAAAAAVQTAAVAQAEAAARAAAVARLETALRAEPITIVDVAEPGPADPDGQLAPVA